MASLDVAGALQNIAAAWSNITAWQSICGVATAAEALERIHIGGTNDEDETIVPATIIIVESLPLTINATKLRGKLTARISCWLAIPPERCGTYQDQYLWVCEQWSAIMRGLETNANQAGGLMLNDLTVSQVPGEFERTVNSGRKEWLFSFRKTIELL